MSEALTLPPRRLLGWPLVALILIAELAVIGITYKHGIHFNCIDNWPRSVCRSASMSMVAVYTAAAAAGIFAIFAPAAVRQLFAEAAPRRLPLLINLLGALVMMAPLPLLVEGSGTRHLPMVLALWLLGAGLGGLGALLMLAPWPRWRSFLRTNGLPFGLCVLAGLLAPVLAQRLFPIWRIEFLADLTFGAVQAMMELAGYSLLADPVHKVIGNESFSISVAPVCSGVEGFALITLFLTIYLALFRRDLRFPAAFLLYPIGILASWCLNVVRISALLAIGIGGHPELAVGGFHSHAGWLMFTLLSLGIVGLTRMTGLFATAPRGMALQAPPFLRDPMVAMILPFAVFMASALLASSFSNAPALVYPMRALAMAAALALFLPYLRTLPWRVDPLAVASGVLIGLGWLLVPGGGSAAPYGNLAGTALFLWQVARVIGTVVLVPVIEELFFRGYLLQRVAPAGSSLLRLALALIISTAGFALLHDRWWAAALAGIVFAGLTLRQRNITDAILSHSVSNAVIAVAAIWQNDWSLI